MKPMVMQADAGPEAHAQLDALFSGKLREDLGLDLRDLPAIALVAQKAAEAGDPAFAFKAFAVLVMADPLTLAYQIGLAETALALEVPEAALQAASAIIVASPANPLGYLLSGQACLAMGLHAEAREDLEDAAAFAKEARLGEIFAQCQALLARIP